MVEWSQVILDTIFSDIPSLNDSNISINPTHMPVTDQGLNNDIVIDQNNHDLAVRVNENDFDANSLHENLDDTVLNNDAQGSEVAQNIHVDDSNRSFEN